MIQSRIKKHLGAIYGPESGQDVWEKLEPIIKEFLSNRQPAGTGDAIQTLESIDSLLITYADQFHSPGQRPLQTLAEFIRGNLQNLISSVHLLPFFPYSSDDGFSVIDYTAVDPDIGTWDDLGELQNCCSLMFDAVINHISRESEWFKKYLEGDPNYEDYFIEVDPGENLSEVTRPRAHPLLTQVERVDGSAHVWTTFSADQIDLNYANPGVLLKIIQILLFYIQNGATLIRLDAIAYLWKEIGTSCIHLPQTHEVIKLLRAVLDLASPEVVLITETNVPHEENISYFGEPLQEDAEALVPGDEAQMVYQFPLAPLVLHTFRTADSSILSSWARSIEVPYQSATFLNFIASHDGIGVRPAEGILTEDQIQKLVDQTLAHGGRVSYKANPDGSQSVYELNITLYDMLNDPASPNQEVGLARFLASQAIILSLAGIPGIYVHSLFGSPNYLSGLAATGRARTINRQKFQLEELREELADPDTRTSLVFREYSHLLSIRKKHPGFKPFAHQRILDLDPRLFSILRTSQPGGKKVLCLINISPESYSVLLDPEPLASSTLVDLISEAKYQADEVLLAPYQVLWLV